MSWNLDAEERIKGAMETGELEFPDELRGKPLDLSDYFATPEHLRMGYSVLKTSGHVPLQVELLRQINSLENAASTETNPERRDAMKQRIAGLRLQMEFQANR